METEKSISVLSVDAPKQTKGGDAADASTEEKVVVEIVDMRMEAVKQRLHERVHGRTLRSWDEIAKNGTTRSNFHRLTF
jgi:hypothetical protein